MAHLCGRRYGDFYEFFGDDARIVAKALGMVVTRARDGRDACGIPVHRWEDDAKALVNAGHIIALSAKLNPKGDA